MEQWKELAQRLCAVSAYREFLQLPAMEALGRLVRALAAGGAGGALMDAYAETFYQLQLAGHDSLGGYLWEHLRYDETPYGDAAGRGAANDSLTAAARQDIETFGALAAIKSGVWKSAVAAAAGEGADLLPAWRADDTLTFEAVTAAYRENGAGEYARHKAFLWTDHTLLPVADPDLEEHALIGYEDERKEVYDNTRALLSGHSVNNMLLYGAAGTGKSATVKSLLKVPEFSDLRIIEVDKQQLADIPALIRRLAGLRQKFILFVDDLSFETADVGYSVLKTVLEGSIEKRPANVVIYATSNRRHIIRESFADRQGDEVHRRDWLASSTSLSDRFGLEITFSTPDKDEYLEIIDFLAEQAGLTLPAEELHLLAERFALRKGGRSPRTAQQFIRQQSGLTGS